MSTLKTRHEEKDNGRGNASPLARIILRINGKRKGRSGAMLTPSEAHPTPICPPIYQGGNDVLRNPMDKGLNATSASLLGLLHDAPMSGGQLFDIAQKRLGGFWSITRSQVYRELLLMQNKGLVKSGKLGKRNVLPYTITANGKRAFQTWMANNMIGDTIRVPAGLHAAFAQLVDADDLAKRINQEVGNRNAAINRLKERYEELANESGIDNIDPIVLLSMMFSLKFERLVGEWLAEFATLLTVETPDSAYEVDVPVTPREQPNE